MILLWAWLCVVLLMGAVWLFYKITGNPSIVDTAWSIGHWLAGTVLLFANGSNPRSLLLWAALTAWALRLAGYLYWTRIRVGHIDKRYIELSKDWRIAPSLGFFFNFQLQALLIMPLVTSFYLNGQSHNTSLTGVDILGLCIVFVAITLETIADLQLRQFLRAHKGKVCNVGWWQYSRHPNYFFEWLVWVGFALTALTTTHGWLAVVSPLTLYLIMTKVTGPMTERSSLASRGKAYQDYQASTSYFFPSIPKVKK